MTNVFDYLKWRGDMRFSQDPINEIDALVFATLAYIHIDGDAQLPQDQPISLQAVYSELSQQNDYDRLGRNKNDTDLLRMASETPRFRDVELVQYRQSFIPEKATQFAAMSFRLDDETMCIAFRGTDSTLTGWKEDLNMSYQQSVPSQRLALEYTHEMQLRYMLPTVLCGHSKGGNLAVYAAAKSSPMFQQQINAVYNLDGPGFTEYMLGDPGYAAIVPKIHTFIPQSSIVGLMMEREEPATIIRSNSVSVMQHDTFTWEVVGKSFVPMDEITADSRFLDAALTNWLKEMSMEEREKWVETLFALLENGKTEQVSDILQPRNLRAILRRLSSDMNTQHVLSSEFLNLIEAIKQSRHNQNFLKNQGDPLLLP